MLNTHNKPPVIRMPKPFGSLYEVWIGLATVHQRPGAGILLDENDAYVQMLAWASSPDDFRFAVEQAFDEYGFDLLELEDVESLALRRQRAVVDPDLIAKAEEVKLTGFPRFGSFVTWQSDS
jgi:hypothetical protein